jgi:SpoVK/Ycf46/Vps4 family AAA+-type ATPase
MKTTGELLRLLIAAHVAGDNAAFDEAVNGVVQEERRKNHHLLANEIRKIAKNGSDGGTIRDLAFLPTWVARDVPADERGLPLIHAFEPTRTFQELVLRRGIRSALDRIVEENRRRDLLQGHGLHSRRKILFHGPPGCGKTVSAEALAGELLLPVFLVRFDAVVSSYLGETAANLSKVFQYAQSRPAVLFFDEFDAIGKSRDSEEEHGELKRVVNSFLQMLDAFHSPGLVIAATNHERLLDSALWRRFDDVIQFPGPTKREIETLLRFGLRQFATPTVDFPVVASSATRLSHADVERAMRDVMKSAVLGRRSEIVTEDLTRAIAEQARRPRPRS